MCERDCRGPGKLNTTLPTPSSYKVMTPVIRAPEDTPDQVGAPDTEPRDSRRPDPSGSQQSSKVMKSLLWRIHSRSLIPVSYHVVKFIDFLFRRMSGLFQISVTLQGMSEDLSVLRDSHQAVREVLILTLLGQLC